MESRRHQSVRLAGPARRQIVDPPCDSHGSVKAAATAQMSPIRRNRRSWGPDHAGLRTGFAQTSDRQARFRH
ncbi:protein of unknown function [Methylorubrum extorquens DM4]|uniref:Uncharacterized protein n=1 Tax=Methylorubrum extorquens (strain DSM 6343 / CIP 106787 / DM4) TaxID=661410 RepID=C7C8B1_METED|nr:protein of unknown function [Methylorubrum extorquens DM4]